MLRHHDDAQIEYYLNVEDLPPSDVQSGEYKHKTNVKRCFMRYKSRSDLASIAG